MVKTIILYTLIIFHDGFKSESIIGIDGFLSSAACEQARTQVMSQKYPPNWAVCVSNEATIK